MAGKLKRMVTIALTAVLCANSVPAISLAEATEETGGQVATTIAQQAPKALYRLHVKGTEELTAADDKNVQEQESTWRSYEPKTEAAQQEATQEKDASEDKEKEEAVPFDTLELKLDNELTGIEYRVRDNTTTWSEEKAEPVAQDSEPKAEAEEPNVQDKWLKDGEVASAENGIAVFQVRLSDELAEQYDVWYRVRTQDDGWLAWTKNGKNAGSEVSTVEELEVTLLDKGEDAPTATTKDTQETEGQTGESATGSTEQEQGDAQAAEPVAYVAAPETQTTDPAQTAEKTEAEQTTGDQAAQAPADGEVTVTAQSDATAAPTAQEGLGDGSAALTTQADSGITYQAHVQRKGWMDWVSDGESGGTSGQSLRVEGIKIKLNGIDGGIRYKTHVQRVGWQDWVANGNVSGTTGRRLRLEAIVIELTGAAAEKYDVYYRAHVQRLGWLGWAKNGEEAGSADLAYRMEAIQVKLVAKGGNAPSNADANVDIPFVGNMSVGYAVNLKNSGWQDTVYNGSTAGKTGVSARAQQIKTVAALPSIGSIRYSVCTEGGSWQNWTYNGNTAGINGKNLSAVRFELTDTLAQHYNVWYRTHVSRVGWMGWAKNGAESGSDSGSNLIEAIQIKVLPKRYAAPGSTNNPYHISVSGTSNNSSILHGVDVSGWQPGINTSKLSADFVIIKATEGYDGTVWNPEYTKMADNALKSGKLIGFYHYANGLDAKKEAQSFYNAIKAYKGRAIACLDWEDQGNKKFLTGVDVQWCKTFLDELRRLFGGTPFIYTSKSVTNDYNWSSVAKTYPLWGAEYAYADVTYQGYLSNPWQSSRGWGAWGSMAKIHQYGFVNPKPNNGGYDSLDADIFYGTVNQWKNYQQ